MSSLSVYKIDASVNTPFVFLDPSGRFEITGVSISENSSRFYSPITGWVDTYCENPAALTEVYCNIEYMDSGSFGFINLLMEKLNRVHESGKGKVHLKWAYENDDLDMEEYGYDLQKLYLFSVELVPLEPAD